MHSLVRAIYQIGAGADCPAHARRIVASELSDVVSRRTLDELKLMVSELVTNGVQHGASGKDSTITLDLRANGVVRCEVIDHGEGFTLPDDLDSRAGWGLKIVDVLAARWGVNRSREGTRVWFETRPPAPLAVVA